MPIFQRSSCRVNLVAPRESFQSDFYEQYDSSILRPDFAIACSYLHTDIRPAAYCAQGINSNKKGQLIMDSFLLIIEAILLQRFATRFKVNNLLRHNFVIAPFRARSLDTFELVGACLFFDAYHKPRLPFPCGIRALLRRPWFFSFSLGLVVPGALMCARHCCALRRPWLRRLSPCVVQVPVKVFTSLPEFIHALADAPRQVG
jgi:hypothetical protein